jgi:phage I-like protein
MPNRTSPHVAVAALSVDLTVGGATPPKEFRLLPYGRFKAADGSGRPAGLPGGWYLDKSMALAIAAAFNARADARVIDYEHQTLLAEKNGKPAPAAGWIGGLEARDDGLYAVEVEWTAAAAEMIAAKQYRYISPVFPYDKRNGNVMAVEYAALTNYAGLDGLTDLAVMTALAAKFFPDQPTQEEPMKELLKALGLSEAATEAEALAALNAKTASIQGELVALKGLPPDPAKYVEVATLTAVRGELAAANTELAALKAEKSQAEIDKVIADGLAAGKLTPATEPHARKLAGDLAALKGFIDAQPAVITPGTTQTGGKGGGGSDQHSDSDLAVMKAMGLTAEQFATGKKGE